MGKNGECSSMLAREETCPDLNWRKNVAGHEWREKRQQKTWKLGETSNRIQTDPKESSVKRKEPA